MRLINADALMSHYKDICELCGKYKENNGVMCNCCYLDDAKSFLEDMPEIEERHKSEWISCEDKLPEEGKWVLVWYEYFAYGDVNKMVQDYGLSYLYDGFWSGDVQGTRAKCIAWQPLPEPYKMTDPKTLAESKNELKKTIERYILDNEFGISCKYVDTVSGIIIETQRIIDEHWDKYTKEKE